MGAADRKLHNTSSALNIQLINPTWTDLFRNFLPWAVMVGC
jgi:hypothetical protein